MNPMEFVERAVSWIYVRGKLIFLKFRFPGQIKMTKAFRRPLYCRVSSSGSIVVGERTSFNYGCVLVSHQRIEIGEGCLPLMSMFMILTMEWSRVEFFIGSSQR